MPKNKSEDQHSRRPYYFNDSISVFYEMKFGNELINPGDSIRFKNEKGTFKFLQLVHNSQKDVTWIDCYLPSHGTYHSFYVDRLKGPIRAKKSIRKKSNVN